jgi:hypothetical protein
MTRPPDTVATLEELELHAAVEVTFFVAPEA